MRVCLAGAVLWAGASLSIQASEPIPWVYPITTYRVVDGDSIRADLHLGFDLRLVGWSCRLKGIDAPEMNGAHRAAGIVVKKAAEDWCKDNEPLYVQSISLDPYPRRFVGRILGRNGASLGDHLLKCQLVKPFDGNRRVQWTPTELQAIERLETK